MERIQEKLLNSGARGGALGAHRRARDARAQALDKVAYVRFAVGLPQLRGRRRVPPADPRHLSRPRGRPPRGAAFPPPRDRAAERRVPTVHRTGNGGACDGIRRPPTARRHADRGVHRDGDRGGRGRRHRRRACSRCSTRAASSGAAAQLATDIQFARSEAVARNRAVRLSFYARPARPATSSTPAPPPHAAAQRQGRPCAAAAPSRSRPSHLPAAERVVAAGQRRPRCSSTRCTAPARRPARCA